MVVFPPSRPLKVQKRGNSARNRGTRVTASNSLSVLAAKSLGLASIQRVLAKLKQNYFLTNPILSSITRKGPTGTFLGLAVIARNINLSSMILRMRSLNTSTVKSSPAQRR